MTDRDRAALRAWMEPDAFEEQRVEALDFKVQGDKVLVLVRDWVEGVLLQEDVAELGDLSFLDAEILYEAGLSE